MKMTRLCRLHGRRCRQSVAKKHTSSAVSKARKAFNFTILLKSFGSKIACWTLSSSSPTSSNSSCCNNAYLEILDLTTLLVLCPSIRPFFRPCFPPLPPLPPPPSSPSSSTFHPFLHLPSLLHPCFPPLLTSTTTQKEAECRSNSIPKPTINYSTLRIDGNWKTTNVYSFTNY